MQVPGITAFNLEFQNGTAITYCLLLLIHFQKRLKMQQTFSAFRNRTINLILAQKKVTALTISDTCLHSALFMICQRNFRLVVSYEPPAVSRLTLFSATIITAMDSKMIVR